MPAAAAVVPVAAASVPTTTIPTAAGVPTATMPTAAVLGKAFASAEKRDCQGDTWYAHR
jgi:hypothetical protein